MKDMRCPFDNTILKEKNKNRFTCTGEGLPAKIIYCEKCGRACDADYLIMDGKEVIVE